MHSCIGVLAVTLLPSPRCQTGDQGKSVCSPCERETEMIPHHLHLPVDRGGNGNPPCVRPVKRQFPTETPLLCTALCYAFIMVHTHTHFQQIHTVIKLCILDPKLSDLFLKPLSSQAVAYRGHSLPRQPHTVCVHMHSCMHNCVCHIQCIYPHTVYIIYSMWVTLCVYCRGLLL